LDEGAVACAVRKDEADFNGVTGGTEAGGFDIDDRGRLEN
jgi:hypothetical protein